MFFFYISYTYYELFIYLIICILLSFVISLICYILANQNLYYEKTTGYECGFNPFSAARDPFNIKFFLISVLFLIFDIEMLFFFPWSISLTIISLKGYYVMYFFYCILILGFFFEWKKNCINLN